MFHTTFSQLSFSLCPARLIYEGDVQHSRLESQLTKDLRKANCEAKKDPSHAPDWELIKTKIIDNSGISAQKTGPIVEAASHQIDAESCKKLEMEMLLESQQNNRKDGFDKNQYAKGLSS